MQFSILMDFFGVVGVLHVCISGIGTGGRVFKDWWMSYLRKVTVQKESLF